MQLKRNERNSLQVIIKWYQSQSLSRSGSMHGNNRPYRPYRTDKKYQKSTLQGEVNYRPTLRNKTKNDLQPYQTPNSVDYACGPS